MRGVDLIYPTVIIDVIGVKLHQKRQLLLIFGHRSMQCVILCHTYVASFVFTDKDAATNHVHL
jgi:hypothetical protein